MDESVTGAALSSIRAAVDELNTVALWSRTNTVALDETRECFMLLQSFEAAYLTMVADLEGRVLPQGLTTKAFLRSALRRTTGQAAGDVRAALTRLPKSGEAFTTGEISRAHMDVIVKTVERIPVDLRHGEVPRLPEFDSGEGETVTVIEAVDAFFAQRARQYDSYQLQCLAKALLAALKPNEDDGFDPLAHERRQETHARDDAGLLHGTFTLDAANGVDFAAAVDHFSAPVAKRVETAEDGSEVEIIDTRAPAQRRADALGLIARLAMSAAEAGTRGGEPPRVVLYTGVEDYHDLHCPDPAHRPRADAASRAGANTDADTDTDVDVGADTGARRDAAAGVVATAAGRAGANTDVGAGVAAGGVSGDGGGVAVGAGVGAERVRQGRTHGGTDTRLGAIGPALLARFSCDAVLQVALMQPTGAILDLGRDVRTITPAQRRALAARDRGCVIPGCTAPASWCHGHHVTWWEKGGLTDLSNLALVCGHHHTVVHLGLWELRMIDGVPWARPPSHVDPRRRWVRNTFHHDLDNARALGTRMRLDQSTDGYDAEAQRLPGPDDTG